jgi:hypothetical protein
MALSEKVEEHLKEAEASLRAALSFAARTEPPMVTSVIAKTIDRIDNLIEFQKLLDRLDNIKMDFDQS